MAFGFLAVTKLEVLSAHSFLWLARLFLHSVASALLGVLLLVLVATYVFVEFFVNPMQLRTNQHFEGQCGF